MATPFADSGGSESNSNDQSGDGFYPSRMMRKSGAPSGVPDLPMVRNDAVSSGFFGRRVCV